MTKKATSSADKIKTEINTKDACRVCMKKQTEMSCIFGEGCDIIEKIEYCTGLQATEEDGLPSLICKNCMQDLATAYKFKSSCLLAYKVYRNLLKTELEITIQYDDIDTFTAPTPDELQEGHGNDDDDSNIDEKDFVWDDVTEEQHLKLQEAVNVEGNGTLNKTPKNDSQDSRIKPIYWCELCKIDLQNKFNKKEHMNSIHKLNGSPGSGGPIVTTKPIHWCETCKIDLKNKLNKEEHMKSIHKLDVLQGSGRSGITIKPVLWGETCKVDLKYKLKKEEDMKSIHKLEFSQGSGGPIVTTKPIHWCELCKIDLKYKLKKEEHMKSIHKLDVSQSSGGPGTTIKPIHWCETCKIDLKNKLNKEEHMKSIHKRNVSQGSGGLIVTTKPKHWCETCKIDLKTKLNKDKHMKSIHKRNVSQGSGGPIVTTKPVNWCETCKINLKTKLKKERHMKKVHNLEPPPETWICEVCGIIKTKKWAIQQHRMLHLPPRYGCDQCEYKATFTADLKKHKLVHAGIKNIQCQICAARFRTRSQLMYHTRREHEKIPPNKYMCLLCDKGFYFNCDLKRHMDRHTRTKRYQCDNCSSSFVDRKKWKKHCIVKHNIAMPLLRPGRKKAYETKDNTNADT